MLLSNISEFHGSLVLMHKPSRTTWLCGGGWSCASAVMVTIYVSALLSYVLRCLLSGSLLMAGPQTGTDVPGFLQDRLRTLPLLTPQCVLGYFPHLHIGPIETF